MLAKLQITSIDHGSTPSKVDLKHTLQTNNGTYSNTFSQPCSNLDQIPLQLSLTTAFLVNSQQINLSNTPLFPSSLLRVNIMATEIKMRTIPETIGFTSIIGARTGDGVLALPVSLDHDESQSSSNVEFADDSCYHTGSH